MTAHLGVHPSTICHLRPSIHYIHPSTHIHVLFMHSSSTVSSIHPSCACTASSHLSRLLFAASWGFFQAGRTLPHTDFRHRQSYKSRLQRSVAVFAASAACLRSFRHKFLPNPSRFEWVEVIFWDRGESTERLALVLPFVIAGVFNSLFYFIRRPWCLYLHFCLVLPSSLHFCPSLSLSFSLFITCAAAACGSVRWWYDWARGCWRLTGYVSSGSRWWEFSCLCLIGVRERCLF